MIPDYVKEIDLIALIESDLGKGESTGKWVKFDCPFCKYIRRDSKKFLLVTNGDKNHGSGYVCKFCQKSGNALSYLKEKRRMSYFEALDYLRGPYVRPRAAGYFSKSDV